MFWLFSDYYYQFIMSKRGPCGQRTEKPMLCRYCLIFFRMFLLCIAIKIHMTFLKPKCRRFFYISNDLA